MYAAAAAPNGEQGMFTTSHPLLYQEIDSKEQTALISFELNQLSNFVTFSSVGVHEYTLTYFLMSN